jgi:hypothetical protein
MAPATIEKGTARLAFGSWEENIQLEVLPVGINYSSFRRFSKNVFINFGEIISRRDSIMMTGRKNINHLLINCKNKFSSWFLKLIKRYSEAKILRKKTSGSCDNNFVCSCCDRLAYTRATLFARKELY